MGRKKKLRGPPMAKEVMAMLKETLKGGWRRDHSDNDSDSEAADSPTPMPMWSASARKIQGQVERSEQSVTELADTVSAPEGYRFIEMQQLSVMLSACICATCGKGKLKLVEDNAHRRGWASKLGLRCTVCNRTTWTCTLPETTSGSKDVNKRAVIAARSIGKGRRACAMFSSLMDLPPPVHFRCWRNHTVAWGETVNDTLQEHFDSVVLDLKRKRIQEGLVEDILPHDLQNMSQEEIMDTVMDVPITIDGSWSTRGKDSNNGFVTVISADSGHVLDGHFMTKSCLQCSKWDNKDKNSMEYLEWFSEHGQTCLKHHSGSAASMESEGAVELFHRSMVKYNLWYNPYIGDGDSSAYKKVCQSQPYGPDYHIEKEECVGHLQKRMGTRLRRLLEKKTGQQLADGKKMSGAGRLTMTRVDSFQCWYGQALRQHAGDPGAASRATWALLYHYAEEADHNYCPSGPESWCKFQNDLATGNATYVPPAQPLPEAVVLELLPIFRYLANEDLLKHCGRSITQNANESLHHLVWTLVPKEQFHSADALQLGIDVAILWFNIGRLQTTVLLYENEGLSISAGAKESVRLLDETRIQNSIYQGREDRKRKRKERRQTKSAQLEAFKKAEGPSYKSGAFLGAGACTSVRATPKCKHCGKPRKGHPRGSCSMSSEN